MTNPLKINYKVSLIAISVLIVLIAFPYQLVLAGNTKENIYQYTNDFRQSRGLSALNANALLEEAAQKRAEDMFNQQYFEHNSPIGATPWDTLKLVDYNYNFAGENLAMGFSSDRPAFDAWLNSPTHYANIISNNFNEIGVAVKSGKMKDEQTTIVVQYFGKQKPELVKRVEVVNQTIVDSGSALKNTFTDLFKKIFKISK